MDIEDIGQLDDKEVIARANAQAWNPESDEYISIAKLEYDVKPEAWRISGAFCDSERYGD